MPLENVASGLGSCQKCRGPLCVSGREVACERCGHPHPDHPAVKGWGGAKEVPSSFSVPHAENMGGLPERLAAAERKLTGLEAEVRDLKAALARKK